MSEIVETGQGVVAEGSGSQEDTGGAALLVGIIILALIFGVVVASILFTQYIGENLIKNVGKKTKYKYGGWDYFFMGQSIIATLKVIFDIISGGVKSPTNVIFDIVINIGIILYFLYVLPALYNINEWVGASSWWVGAILVSALRAREISITAPALLDQAQAGAGAQKGEKGKKVEAVPGGDPTASPPPQ